MFKKKKKEEKEPNLKLTLAVAVFFIVLFLFCYFDTLKNLGNGNFGVTIFISVVFGGYIIALLWVTWHIIKRIRAEKQKK